MEKQSPERVGEIMLAVRVRESALCILVHTKETVPGLKIFSLVTCLRIILYSLSWLYFWLLISHRDLESDGLDLLLGVIVAVLSWQGRVSYLECAFLGKFWVVATYRVWRETYLFTLVLMLTVGMFLCVSNFRYQCLSPTHVLSGSYTL